MSLAGVSDGPINYIFLSILFEGIRSDSHLVSPQIPETLVSRVVRTDGFFAVTHSPRAWLLSL